MPIQEALRLFFAAKASEYPNASAPHEIAVALSQDSLSPSRLKHVVDSYGLGSDQGLRGLFLDWVLDYARIALGGEPLASSISGAIEPVKQALGIEEGEFLRLRPAETKALLCEQLELVLEDGILDDQEELAQSALQRAFDLGYDQYLALTRPLYERALQDVKTALSGAKALDRPALERRQLSLRAVAELAVVQPRSIGGLR